MGPYLVKFVFQIICGEGRHRIQFDEQYRVVMACTQAEAEEISTQMGKDLEETFCNDRGLRVHWKFLRKQLVGPVPPLAHGMELFSQIREGEERPETGPRAPRLLTRSLYSDSPVDA